MLQASLSGDINRCWERHVTLSLQLCSFSLSLSHSLSVSLSVCLCLCLSVCLSHTQTLFLSHHNSVCLSVSVSLSPQLSLSLCVLQLKLETEAEKDPFNPRQSNPFVLISHGKTKRAGLTWRDLAARANATGQKMAIIPQIGGRCAELTQPQRLVS